MSLYTAGPQSGGRRPAPGRLALVQAFANSFFDLRPAHRGEDRLATPARAAEWLAERGLEGPRAPEAQLRRALALRAGLQAVLRGHNGETVDAAAIAGLRAAADGLGAAMAVDGDGRMAPALASEDLPGVLGLVLALVAEAQAAGTWPRLKACPGHHCGWAFYDASRNGASTWCSMRVCGGREKARAYRRRAASGGEGRTDVRLRTRTPQDGP